MKAFSFLLLLGKSNSFNTPLHRISSLIKTKSENVFATDESNYRFIKKYCKVLGKNVEEENISVFFRNYDEYVFLPDRKVFLLKVNNKNSDIFARVIDYVYGDDDNWKHQYIFLYSEDLEESYTNTIPYF